ncbi:MAG TPA: glycosyltransferase [archaeon]|nr:glycosyltransferase [archaeon]
MKKPKFSFIIPSLNEEKYIENCLKSIKNQAYNSHEIIVVDSYSRDKTVKIAKKYTKKIIFEKKKGPGIARNGGAKIAKGNILIFADSDVIFEKDFLERLGKKFRKNIGGCIFRLAACDAENYTDYASYRYVNLIVKFLIKIGIVMTAGSCFAFDRKTFREAGGYNPEFITNEDHELASRINKIKRFRYFGDIKVFVSTRRVRKLGFWKSLKIYFKSTVVFFLNRSYLRHYW